MFYGVPRDPVVPNLRLGEDGNTAICSFRFEEGNYTETHWLEASILKIHTHVETLFMTSRSGSEPKAPCSPSKIQ